MKRKDAIQDRGRIGESRGLFDVLAQEGTQVLDNFVGWLHEVVVDAEFDEGSNGNR